MSTSIARALTRLKHIEQKFEDNINQTILFAVAKGGKCINTGQAKEVFEVEASGKLQGIKDQVSAGVKARLAIAEANMNTKITVAGIEMTIAEALIFKQYGIPKLMNMINFGNRTINALKTEYRKELTNWESIAKDTPQENIENCKSLFFPELIGPDKEMQELVDFVNTFVSELDGILNESNALTMIEV